MATDLVRPTELESQAIEARIRRELLAVATATILWGTLTNLFWFGVDFVLERPRALDFFVERVIIATPLLLIRARTLREPNPTQRDADAFSVALVVLFGLIAPAVAVSEHYEVYVLGFSMIIWASGVLMRWRWQVAALAYGLLLLEFWVSELLPGAQPSMALFFGTLVYLGTAAMLMTVQAATARTVERESILLALRLEQRNLELSHAMEELSRTQSRLVETEKLSALGRLLAGLSHEMNNPINVICNTLGSVLSDAAVLSSALDSVRREASQGAVNAEQLERILPVAEQAGVAQELNEAIGDLDAGAQRIRNIHRDLRSFVRGDSEARVEAQLEPGLQSTVGLLKRTAPEGITLEMSGEQAPPVLVRPDQINQIVFNLVQNAIDAMGTTGRVSIGVASEDKEVVVSVTDTGPGVSEAVAKRLFEPFFTTKGVGQGTGLGLAISRELAMKNGGTLDLSRGRHGSGTRLEARLPRADQPGSAR